MVGVNSVCLRVANGSMSCVPNGLARSARQKKARSFGVSKLAIVQKLSERGRQYVIPECSYRVSTDL
ncbi:hypothetical protein QUF64_09105 [Anaerolineales bacterium HSG6]|nr:hypothetical protein [Anaerolineales bacterium HSG6]